MSQLFPTESVFWTLIRIIFWGAIVYAVMRTFWAVWEIPEKLRDIESRLAVLADEMRGVASRLKASEGIEKEPKQE